MKTKAKKRCSCRTVLLSAAGGDGASTAQAQTGGIGAPSVEPAAADSRTSAASWTVYKKATWYGPGFWGNSTACGMVLQRTVIGAAHKKLPCGTQVTFTHGASTVTATVIDRGPFHKGYAWDLTKKTAKRIGFLAVGAGPIQATVTPAY